MGDGKRRKGLQMGKEMKGPATQTDTIDDIALTKAIPNIHNQHFACRISLLLFQIRFVHARGDRQLNAVNYD